jgi:hypothetical protein
VTAITVSLTAAELHQAAMIAVQRQIENLFAGRRDAHGASRDVGWSLHIEGAAGEMAFAKWAGLYWSGNIGNLSADDVGATQVRTRSRHDYDLILHPSDPDNRVFVLVTGTAPEFRLVGWIWGGEGKRPEFWSDPARGRPAFFVPQSALHPMPMRRAS